MKKQKWMEKGIAVLLLLAIWQAAAMLLDRKILLASPVDVFLRLFTIWREEGFFASIGFSFVRIAGGFFLGLLLGTLLAVLAGRSRAMEILLHPLMLTIKSVPVASFIIIALIWMTSSSLSVFISFLMVLPVIYNNVLGGIQNTDGKLLEMADVFRFSYGKKFRYIYLPSVEPYLLSACRTALGLAWKAGIAAEVIGIPNGSIGEMLYEAKAYLNTVDLFAWTVIIVLISVLFEKLCLFVLGRILKREKERF